MGETDRPKSWFFLSFADRDAKGNPQIRAFFEKLALEVASSVARARRTWRHTASGRTGRCPLTSRAVRVDRFRRRFCSGGRGAGRGLQWLLKVIAADKWSRWAANGGYSVATP